MKKKIIIANWKMSLGHQQTLDLTQALVKKSKEDNDLEIVVCPSFASIEATAKEIKKSAINLGAQNCFWEQEGAYTGEVSPSTLKEIGCKYVIIGHSERRGSLCESDEMVNKKVKAAFANGLVPIICVGETFEERQAGNKDFVIMQQVKKAIEDIKLLGEQCLIIAYEPVWVIGSGQAVNPEEAEHTNQVIRQVLLDHFSLETTDQRTQLIYGGSVNPNNVSNFMSQPTIEGALIGGASLEAETFWQLIQAAR